jgi:hypothetical protein
MSGVYSHCVAHVRVARLRDRLGHGVEVGRAVVLDAVELDEVHAPGREPVHERVVVELRALRMPRPVEALHASAVVVLLGRAERDLARRVLARRAELDAVGARLHGRVLDDGLMRDAGRQIDAELQSEAVDVVGEDRDAVLAAAWREGRRVRDPAAPLIDVGPGAARALVVEVVEVDVAVAGGLQAAAHHRVGLRLDQVGGRRSPQGAPAAPAEYRLEAVAQRVGLQRACGRHTDAGGDGDRCGKRGQSRDHARSCHDSPFPHSFNKTGTEWRGAVRAYAPRIWH